MVEQQESSDDLCIVRVDGAEVQAIHLTMTNNIERFSMDYGLKPINNLSVTVDAEFELAQADYERIVSLPLTHHTVVMDTDHNPWHRRVKGWRHLIKLRDGLWWSVQKHLLRRPLVHHTKITVPNCILAGVLPSERQTDHEAQE